MTALIQRDGRGMGGGMFDARGMRKRGCDAPVAALSLPVLPVHFTGTRSADAEMHDNGISPFFSIIACMLQAACNPSLSHNRRCNKPALLKVKGSLATERVKVRSECRDEGN